MDFVLERVQKRFGKYFDTKVQPFTHLYAETREISVTGPDGNDVKPVLTLIYNNPTPEGGVEAPLVALPIDDTTGSGCTETQWEGIDVEGKLVLIKRGVCAIADKLKIAKNRGAVGVLLINNLPGDSLSSATLSAENYGLLAPVALITLEQGTAWKERVDAGEELSAHLLVDVLAEDRESFNIISTTKEGDQNNVVMLGAHLDSVLEGAGLNDDGSGSAALLEIAGSVKAYSGFKNAISLAWWGAEESGLVGSLYYTSQLTEEEADAVRFYYNYDMIGSMEPQWAVYGDTDAHKTGGKYLIDYLESQGKDSFYGSFGSSSDYVGFLELGIPSSGIFTGAGAPWDVCYHLACDGLDNVNWEALTINTKAAGRAAAELALSMDGIPPREKTSVNPKSKRGSLRNFIKWSAAGKAAVKEKSCAHGKNNTI